MNTNYADEYGLLLAEWRKQGISGNPTIEDVVLFAERRYMAAYRAWVEQMEFDYRDELAEMRGESA